MTTHHDPQQPDNHDADRLRAALDAATPAAASLPLWALPHQPPATDPEPTAVVDHAGDLWARGRDGTYYPIVIGGDHRQHHLERGVPWKVMRIGAEHDDQRRDDIVGFRDGSPIRRHPDSHQDPATSCVADGCHWDNRGTAHGAGAPACQPGNDATAPADCLLSRRMYANPDRYRRTHPGAPTPRPWGEGQQPTAEQLHHWLVENRDQPAARGVVATLLAAAARGTRCFEHGHAEDLAQLGRIADALAAARARIQQLETTHPADLDDPLAADGDQA